MSGPGASGPGASASGASLDAAERATFLAVADQLIPAAHGMPSAADILSDDRLRFVLNARPDLTDPLRAALRPDLGEDVGARLETLGRDEPSALGALQLAIVAGYYTDKTVRERIEYPGQMALEIRTWEVPPYIDEGLIDAVLARGQVWRDPSTGQRAVTTDTPTTYAERWSTDAATAAAASTEGGPDGHDRA